MQARQTARKRFTESIWGKSAAILLALLWIASMTMMDSEAYSSAPYICGLLVVVALWGTGVALGYRTVQLRLVVWLSLAAGCYFLWRCHTSYSVVEAWHEAALIFGCFVFYMAGVYAGQGENSRLLMGTVMAALLLNALSYWFTRDGQSSLPWSLRPATGVCGPTTGNVALFTYKNFAAFFLIAAGFLPLCRLVCRAGAGLKDILLAGFGLVTGGSSLRTPVGRDLLLALVGLGTMGIAFFVGSRAVWLLAPVLLCFIWLVCLLVTLGENRKIGIPLAAVGLALFVGVSIIAYDFFFGHTITGVLGNLDTHLRAMAWELACDTAPNGGLCGYGARASQWEIVQRFNDWCTPNMLHNEYLQVWLDYGRVGLFLMAGVLLLHFGTGFRQLLAEEASPERHAKAAMALTFLLAASLFAICDFGWHQAALSSATAFACGVLASPYPHRPFRWCELGRNWAPGSRPSATPVRAEKAIPRLILLVLGCALAVDMVRIAAHTTPAWVASWRLDHMVKKHGIPTIEQLRHLEDGKIRLENALILLEDTHTTYPDSRLIDYYIQLQPIPAGRGLDTMESMLRRTLEANPRQVFMSIMLAGVSGREMRYEEAERILRAAYDGDGTCSTRTNTWPFYYAYNLVRWGQQKMSKGDFATARSMLEYGLRVADSPEAGFPNTAFRAGNKPAENERRRKFFKKFFDDARLDSAFLRRLGVEPDDSWQRPMEEGGKPALYRRLQSVRR